VGARHRHVPHLIEIVSPATVVPVRLTANRTPEPQAVLEVKYQQGCGPPCGVAVSQAGIV
jgi:hypothetical protein